jgi:hypothetical protein
MDRKVRLPLALGLLAAVLLMAAIAGCARGGTTPAPEVIRSDPDFVGFVLAAGRVRDAGYTGIIVAESHADKIVTRYTVWVADDTPVFGGNTEGYHLVRFAALRPKQWVQIWFAGPAPDDFGASVRAVQVVIAE